jgi:hypothetical protein
MGAKIVRRERGEVAVPQDLKPLNEADYSIIMTWPALADLQRIIWEH